MKCPPLVDALVGISLFETHYLVLHYVITWDSALQMGAFPMWVAPSSVTLRAFTLGMAMPFGVIICPIYYINSLVLSVCLSVRRQFCTDTAFSMAEPAGGVCPSVEVLKPRSQLSVCRGPETQIPTNILIHLSLNIFVLGTYWNLF
jgi:hypothetical protein